MSPYSENDMDRCVFFLEWSNPPSLAKIRGCWGWFQYRCKWRPKKKSSVSLGLLQGKSRFLPLLVIFCSYSSARHLQFRKTVSRTVKYQHQHDALHCRANFRRLQACLCSSTRLTPLFRLPPSLLPYWPLIRACLTPEIGRDQWWLWPKSVSWSGCNDNLNTICLRRTVKSDLGKVYYLTIEESSVEAGKSQRRPGLHVDSPGEVKVRRGRGAAHTYYGHDWGRGCAHVTGVDPQVSTILYGGIYLATNLGWETSILGTIGKLRYTAKRARARTQNPFHSIPHDLGMIPGFYRPQKDLS